MNNQVSHVELFLAFQAFPPKSGTLDLGRRPVSLRLFTTNRPLPCPTYVFSISYIPLILSLVVVRNENPLILVQYNGSPAAAVFDLSHIDVMLGYRCHKKLHLLAKGNL